MSRAVFRDDRVPATALGRNIQRLAKSIGANASTFADLCGVSVSVISSAVNRGHNLSKTSLDKIAKANGIKPEDLFREDLEITNTVVNPAPINGSEQRNAAVFRRSRILKEAEPAQETPKAEKQEDSLERRAIVALLEAKFTPDEVSHLLAIHKDAIIRILVKNI